MKGIRIIVVDDEPCCRKIATLVLESCGHIVVKTFETANDALRELDAHAIDLIVSDYSMPGLTGRQFRDRVTEKYPDILFILLSGDPPSDFPGPVVQKTLLVKELNRTIRQELNKTSCKKVPNP